MMKHGSRLLAVLAITVSCQAVIAAEPAPQAIVDTYSNIALAGYEDALSTAKALDTAVAVFLD